MRPAQARYVTLCQQALAVGVVIAMLGPAAGVMSLEVVVRPGPQVQQAPVETEAPARAEERLHVARPSVRLLLDLLG